MPDKTPVRLEIEAALKAGEILDAYDVRSRWGADCNTLRRAILGLERDGFNVVRSRGSHGAFRYSVTTGTPVDNFGSIAGLIGQRLRVKSVELSLNNHVVVLEDNLHNIFKMTVESFEPGRVRPAHPAAAPVTIDTTRSVAVPSGTPVGYMQYA